MSKPIRIYGRSPGLARQAKELAAKLGGVQMARIVDDPRRATIRLVPKVDD